MEKEYPFSPPEMIKGCATDETSVPRWLSLLNVCTTSNQHESECRVRGKGGRREVGRDGKIPLDFQRKACGSRFWLGHILSYQFGYLKGYFSLDTQMHNLKLHY